MSKRGTNLHIHGAGYLKRCLYYQDGYGPFGRPREATTPFVRLRIKKYYKRGYRKVGCPYEIVKIELQKKARDAFGRPAWVTLGCYDTENEALVMLEQEAEIMNAIEDDRIFVKENQS